MDPAEQSDQRLRFLSAEPRAQPSLVRGDRHSRASKRITPCRRQRQREAPCVRRPVARQQPELLQGMDNCHRCCTVHLQPAGKIGLRDAGLFVRQPQHRHLLLGQPDRREMLTEMPLHRAVCQA